MFACVGWQVTLCDPIWQVTPGSGEMEFHNCYTAPLTFKSLAAYATRPQGRFKQSIRALKDKLNKIISLEIFLEGYQLPVERAKWTFLQQRALKPRFWTKVCRQIANKSTHLPL